MITDSWWCGLTREQFPAAVQREAERMATDRRAKHVNISPHQFADNPRKSRKTEYVYHLEDERLTA